jgi:hypothetical protein
MPQELKSMLIEHYLTEHQDPRTAEKVLGKLRDMLTTGEDVIYLAIQKRPALTLIPDCIAVTNKRIVFCIPENLGLTTAYKTFPWAEVKQVSFKEEFFGSKFITIPQRGENVAIDFIPKVQARKLYQFCNEQLEKVKPFPGFEEKISVLQNENIGDDYASYIEVVENNNPVINGVKIAKPEDEITLKLQKLKTLHENHLISQDEYENKKAEILSRL